MRLILSNYFIKGDEKCALALFPRGRSLFKALLVIDFRVSTKRLFHTMKNKIYYQIGSL